MTESTQERDGNLGEVIDRRVQVYGNPAESFAQIAQNWSSILGHEVQAWQVPIMMIGMKSVRMRTSPDYSDHSDDIEGYLDIFRTIIGDDMIIARSVTEYIEKKWPAEVIPDQEALDRTVARLATMDSFDTRCSAAEDDGSSRTYRCELHLGHDGPHWEATMGSWE